MIRHFPLLAFIVFFPFLAIADFSASDSESLLEIRNKMQFVDRHLNSIDTTSGNSANYLNYIGNKVDSINGNVGDVESHVDDIRAALLTPYSTQYDQSVLQWMWIGSKSVHDFLSATKSFIPTLYYTSSSEDGSPVVSLTSMPYVGNYPDFFLSYLQERQHYDTMSTVRSQQLQRENINTLLSVNKNISSITNFLDTPVFNSGTSQTYEYDHLDPSSASMDNAPVVSTSTIQFTGGQNFIKWFGVYSKQMFQAIGRLNSSVVKQQYRIWDLQQKSAAVTNIADRILLYDIAQSNLLSQIVSDSKKSSDVFSNLWAHTFLFPTAGSERFYFYTFPGSVSPSAWPDSTPSYVVSYEVPSSSSLTSILDSFHRNFLSVHSNFFKYLYSFQEQAKDIRSKLTALPSAISTALSGLDVNVVNTVNVSGGGSSSTNSLQWAYDKNAMLVWFGQQLEAGPLLEDLEPSADLDVSQANLALAAGGLSGNLNQDLPYLLSWVIRQNANNNTGVFSILTNLQMIVGSQVSEDTSQSEDEFDSFVSDTTANYEHLLTEIQTVRENPHTFNVDEHRQAWSGFVSPSGPLGFLADAARWNDEVVLDLMFMHTGSSAVPGGFDWGSVSGHWLYYRLDISKYRWFFDLMRCVSILGIWWLVFKLLLFFLRLYLKLFKLSYKVYISLVGGGS